MADCCAPNGAGNSFDLAVIGAGSAGFSAAITAAEAGARVALIGHGTIGGTCVNVGCVPSKTMIRATEALHGAREAERFRGISAEAHITDWKKLIAAKDDLVGTLRQKKYIDLLPEYPGITYMEGRAKLTPGGVVIGDELFKAAKIILATGASAAVPAIKGIESLDYLDSTRALDLDALPQSLLVIGGGVIGCELGQMFARAGSKVTICCRSRLLPEFDVEISQALQSALELEGVTICAGVGYQDIRRTDKGIKLLCESKNDPRSIEAEKLLVASGRAPNISGLGLEGSGVEIDARGSVKIDQYMRTSNPDIYAAGDVTGVDMFVYMAAYGAKLAARNALEGDTHAYDNAAMPSVVFTDPQAAMVGVSEQAARAAGLRVKTSILPLDHVPRALAARDTRGLIKLVADEESGQLLGVQILAPEGGDSIQTAVLAIKFGMSTKDLGETIFPYLTTGEGLKLAAQGFEKDVAKLSCCAG